MAEQRFNIDAVIAGWYSTKKQRLRKGEIINERREKLESGKEGEGNRKISMTLFVALLFLIAGAWAAYF